MLVSSLKDRLLESEVLEITFGTFECSSLCGFKFIAPGSYAFLFSVRLVRALLAHICVTGTRQHEGARPTPQPDSSTQLPRARSYFN